MSRGCRRRVWCTRWCAITSKPSAHRPPVCATGKGCPGSSSRPPSRTALRRASPKPWRRREFRALLGADAWPAASRASAVMTVASTGSSRSRARPERVVRVAALRPVENLRVVVSPVERRPCSGPSRATSRDGGRRMAERAAHLVDHVFPAVPVRQWVLTLPPRLRYRLAWDYDLCHAVALRPFENLRVAVSLVERRRCSGPSRARSRDGRCLGSDGPRLPAARGPPGWGAGRARRSRGPSTSLRTIPSEVEGWRSFSASAGR